jgi:hypothetical protein
MEQSTYNLPTAGYQCAKCYTIANSWSYAPLQQCSVPCQNIGSDVIKCIQNAVKDNAYVLPEHISCVNKAAARSPMPQNECNTLCIVKYNNCINTKDPKCSQSLTQCQTQCVNK